MLLPAALEEYVGPENAVRFIDAFIDSLDLVEMKFIVARKNPAGAPSFHPGDLLKLYLYGYLHKIRSSRKLMVEARKNVELMWLLKGLHPDFRVISNFRSANADKFKHIFREFTLVAKKLELFGAELIAIDGGKIRASNNNNKCYTKEQLEKLLAQTDEKIADFLQQLEQNDQTEESSGQTGESTAEELSQKLNHFKEKRAELSLIEEQREKSGANQISLIDEDARLMRGGNPRTTEVSYNAQIAVDAKHHLIVAEEVVNDVNDKKQLYPIALQAKQTLVGDEVGDEVDAESGDNAESSSEPVDDDRPKAKIITLGDCGYDSGEQFDLCAKDSVIEALVPLQRVNQGAVKGTKIFPKSDFSYDAEQDHYLCPAQNILPFVWEGKSGQDKHKRYYNNPKACRECPLRDQCTTSKKRGYREIRRHQFEHRREEMAQRMTEQREVAAQRGSIVEHVFGTIFHGWDQGYFLTRGLEKVRGEFSLSCVAYNLRRLLNLKSIPELIAALR